MNNERIAELEKKLNDIMAEIEQLKSEERSKEVKPWRDTKNHGYWIINSNGKTRTMGGDFGGTNLHFEFGNYYRTRDLAEQDAKELAMRGRIRQLRDALCEGYQFKHGKASFCIFFDGEYYRYSSSCNWCLLGTIYFDTAEHAQQACDILNSELRKERGE